MKKHTQAPLSEREVKRLFTVCFTAILASAFAFIIRNFVMGDWGAEFHLSGLQLGKIAGAGFWPFAISMVLFSLVVDSISSRAIMFFAFACHIISILVTVTADGYHSLYWGAFLAALGNGAVEAVVNPVTATLFPKQKTKYLNILHAAWPAGMLLGGGLMLAMDSFAAGSIGGEGVSWQTKSLLMLVPVVLYGLGLMICRFPLDERVEAGISFKHMCQQVGGGGALIISALMVYAVASPEVFDLSTTSCVLLILVITGAFYRYVRSFGQLSYLSLLLIMVVLATTEIATDGWIKELMTPVMTRFELDAGVVVMYTAFLMMVLRFSAGTIAEKVSPPGMLAMSSLAAGLGILWLSEALNPLSILLAATVYGIGQTYFWPTMLAWCSERFPQGGALTINSVAAVGMLGVGVLGFPFIGALLDASRADLLQEQEPALYSEVKVEQHWLNVVSFEGIDPLQEHKLKEKNSEELRGQLKQSESVEEAFMTLDYPAKRKALAIASLLPFFMFVFYLIYVLKFRLEGGYRAIDLQMGTPEVSPSVDDSGDASLAFTGTATSSQD